MNTSKLFLAISSFTALSLVPSLHAQALPKNAPTTANAAVSSSKAPNTADVDIVKAMQYYRRVTMGYQNGTNTAADLSQATVALAEARLHSASLDEMGEVLQNLETIENQRLEMLREAEVGYHLGTTTLAEVKQADAERIEAKTRLDLYKAITSQSGADLKQSVDTAAAALKSSQDLLEDVQKSPAKLGTK